MSSSSAARKKNGQFGPTSKKDWEEIAKMELGKDLSVAKLVHQVDGIDLLPYYDRHDQSTFSGFQIPASQNEFEEPRSWLNLPRIVVTEPVSANQQALTQLNAGADGILFDLREVVDPSVLLHNIELNYCYNTFLADTGQESFFYRFDTLLKEKNVPANSVSGSIFWKQPPADPKRLLTNFTEWKKFRPLGIVGQETDSVSDGISSMLTRLVKQVDATTSLGIREEISLRSVAFMNIVGNDFFQEVAKNKALRLLWYKIIHAYQIDPTPAFIHSVSQAWKNQVYEPHGNMLKGTISGLSAVLGGCDALTIDTSESSMARVALNISSILKEESHFGKVADPTAGSYYLENLVDQLAGISWKKFQKSVS